MDAVKIYDAVDKLKGKGEEIDVVGATQVGKSTSFGSYSENPIVQRILFERKANGKGGIAETDIQVTDHPDIPVDVVVISAKIQDLGMVNLNDDGSFLGEILYAATSDYKRNPTPENFRKSVEKKFKSMLDNPSNYSLGYKIKNAGQTAQADVLEILKQVELSSVYAVLEEANAKELKRSEAIREFVRILKTDNNLHDFIQKFWETVIRVINLDANQLRDELKEAGASFDSSDSDFKIIADKNSLGTVWLTHLLKSEDSSKEYFLDELTLVFRGRTALFESLIGDQFKVFEENGVDVHCIHLIDTKGLFHETEATLQEEVERIKDIITSSHSNSVVFVMSAKLSAKGKEGFEAIRVFLSEATKQINVYVLFTHWDEFMVQEQKDGSESAGIDMSVFSFESAMEVDWDSIYSTARDKEDELVGKLRNAIAANTSRNKPQIVKVIDAANLTNPSSESEKLLYTKRVYYPLALEDMVGEIARQDRMNDSKYRVTSSNNICSVELDGMSQSIRSLYRDMVVNCKDNRLYASTVRACVNKWRYYGAEHKSDVAENAYGFKNITTAFVPEIRNLGMSILSRVIIHTDCVLGNDHKDDFEKALKSYLKECLGREIAKAIGRDSYLNGFSSGPYGLYQYEYFTNMITYTQKNYFRGEQLHFGLNTQQLENKIQEALLICTRNFVDFRCIEVY